MILNIYEMQKSYGFNVLYKFNTAGLIFLHNYGIGRAEKFYVNILKFNR